MLTVDDLVVCFGEHRALASIDLAIADGETLAVLGPSGSGKSTLLRAIAGLEIPTSGRISWDGHDLAGVPPHQRELGLMFQDHALFPHRDVVGNVEFGLRMQRVPRMQARARAEAVVALVGLAGSERRSVRELSGGEQQRVALARALAPTPRLLMLDEPFGSLDRNLRDRLLEEMRSLFEQLHQTVVFVTHDHEEAFAIGDRVAIMAEGRIEQIGPAAEVWRAPATEFAARFLGYNVTRAFGPGLVAVRPELLRVSEHRENDPAAGGVTGTVTARSFRRDHFRIRVDTAAGLLEVTVSPDRDSPLPEVGQPVRVTTPGDALISLPAI